MADKRIADEGEGLGPISPNLDKEAAAWAKATEQCKAVTPNLLNQLMDNAGLDSRQERLEGCIVRTSAKIEQQGKNGRSH